MGICFIVGLISDHSLPIKLAKESLRHENLRFPGKLTISECGKQLAVADTGHSQVVVLTKDGVVAQRFGNGKPGFKDGSSQVSQFSAPQGLTWCGDCIYVADTENHAIRKVGCRIKIILLDS